VSSDEHLLEFGSAAWLDRLALAFQEAAAARPEYVFPVACEVYLDVPTHLLPGNGHRIAWTRRAGHGRATLLLEECSLAEADVKVVGTYAAFRRLARIHVTRDNAGDYQQLVAKATMDGELTIVCDRRDKSIPPDYTAHNIMAGLTR
jgi:hypothetical protein